MLEAIIILVSMLTASATPDTLDHAVISVHTQAETASSSPVQRLDEEELRRSGTAYLNEAIRNLAGVSVKDYGGLGGLKTVSIRNLGGAHTAVIYDGINISDAQNGQVDISRFFTEDLEEVRVSIGQEDDILHSARTLSSAGSLHIRSKVPEFHDGKRNRVKVGVTAGSFGTYNPKIRYEQKINDLWSLSGGAAWLSSKGDYPFTLRNGSQISEEIRLNSDVAILNAEVNIYGQFGEKEGGISHRKGGKFISKINMLSSERGLPGSVVLYTQKPTERLWDRNILASSRYENKFGNNWELETSLSYSNAWNRYTDVSAAYSEPQDHRYTQQEISLSAVVQYSPFASLKIAVAEDLFGNILDSNIPECPFPRRLSNLTALSARYIGRRLKATGSLLGTYFRDQILTAEARKGSDATSQAGKPGAAAPEGGRLSPSLSASYGLIRNLLHIRTSYREGFRVPTFNDLYYARVGNTALVPEKARQFNIGATWNSSHKDILDISFTADGYMNLIKDKIVATPTMFIWKMRNIGKVRMSGLDLSLNLRWKANEWMNLHIRGNASLQKAIDITDPASKNWKHQIPYTPTFTANSVISAQTRWFTATYTLNAVGKRYALAQNIQSNMIEGYRDHSLSLNRSFKIREAGLHLSAEAMNLSGVNYEIIRYYPMPGRNYRITLKVTY